MKNSSALAAEKIINAYRRAIAPPVSAKPPNGSVARAIIDAYRRALGTAR